MSRIGITGSLGSGKTFISKKLFGNNFIEVDDVRRKLLWNSNDNNSIELRKLLIKELRLEIIDDNYNFNRILYTNVVFSSLENLELTNKIITPYIKDSIVKSEIKNINWAYFIEDGYCDLIDCIYIVHTSKNTIKNRLIKSLQNYEYVKNRIDLEPSLESRIKYLINNNIKYEVIINE